MYFLNRKKDCVHWFQSNININTDTDTDFYFLTSHLNNSLHVYIPLGV